MIHGIFLDFSLLATHAGAVPDILTRLREDSRNRSLAVLRGEAKAAHDQISDFIKDLEQTLAKQRGMLDKLNLAGSTQPESATSNDVERAAQKSDSLQNNVHVSGDVENFVWKHFFKMAFPVFLSAQNIWDT